MYTIILDLHKKIKWQNTFHKCIKFSFSYFKMSFENKMKFSILKMFCKYPQIRYEKFLSQMIIF